MNNEQFFIVHFKNIVIHNLWYFYFHKSPYYTILTRDVKVCSWALAQLQTFQTTIIDHLVQNILANKAKILELADKYGATNIRFFTLTKQEGGISDTEVNFLINLPEKASLLEQGGLLMELRELLQFPLYVFTEDGLKEHYHNLILSKAITL